MKPDRTILEQMYTTEEMSLAQIARRLNVSSSSIWKWLKSYNISRRRAPNPDLWNSRKDELIFLYTVHDLSQKQIAKYFETHAAFIYKVMKRLGIKAASKGRRQGDANHRYKDGTQSRFYRNIVIKNQCSKCATTEKLGIHHKNNDHYDNTIENLEVLCNSCHMSETKKAWWAAKKAGLPLPRSNGPVGWNRKSDKCNKQESL